MAVVDGGAALPRGLLEDGALPLYGRTAARLWHDVTAGGARSGDKLPSERALSARYAVSRVTLRSALAALEQRGLVTSSAARGWFVTDHGQTRTAPSAVPHVQGLADYAASRGLSTRTRVISTAARPATAAEAEALRTAPGTALYELWRLRHLDDAVVVLEHNRLPLALCPALAETDFTTASLYATLRAADPPQVPRMADYAVEARYPTGEESALLEIGGSFPVLVATQLAYNQHGRPLELTVAAYRGDRYLFRAKITNEG